VISITRPEIPRTSIFDCELVGCPFESSTLSKTTLFERK
jgi:hypothetical protein